jgi:hypothetical protein
VDKFGVVVIAQQISQVLGRGFSWVDVGVRIDQSDSVEFVKERGLERIHDDSTSDQPPLTGGIKAMVLPVSKADSKRSSSATKAWPTATLLAQYEQRSSGWKRTIASFRVAADFASLRSSFADPNHSIPIASRMPAKTRTSIDFESFMAII